MIRINEAFKILDRVEIVFVIETFLNLLIDDEGLLH